LRGLNCWKSPDLAAGFRTLAGNHAVKHSAGRASARGGTSILGLTSSLPRTGMTDHVSHASAAWSWQALMVAASQT